MRWRGKERGGRKNDGVKNLEEIIPQNFRKSGKCRRGKKELDDRGLSEM